MSLRPPSEVDLTVAEQEHVRNALYFLRAKFESWAPVARLLRFKEQTLSQSASGLRNVSAALTMRLAKTVGVSVEALTSGQFPEVGTCPRCGYHVPIDGRFKHATAGIAASRARRADITRGVA